MTDTNDCRNRQETIAALVLGELDSPAADEIRKHIDSCKSCRLLYEALVEEEESIESAFKAVDDRSKAVGDSLVARYETGLCKSSSEAAILHRLWDGLKMPKRVAELAAAALIIVGVFIGIHLFGSSNVAWAQVVEKFNSVAFFNATIYIKNDGATSEPIQMELWMSRDGRSRFRIGRQVIFTEDGKIIKAFDIETRNQTKPDDMAAMFLERISEAEEFSLDTIIKVMFRGEMQDVTPLVNPSAVISQDVVVFDVDIPNTPEWVRIWALRESRLPTRLKIWDPRDGDSTEAIFEYSREQADEFFDPNAFEKLTRNRRATSRINLAYAYLKDPGGKQVTPEDMFKQSGYHIPEIKHVGITPKGAVWVIADKGLNQTSNGSRFYGFGKIEDDLEREYRSVYSSHRTAADQSREVFVPIDYPFDKRTPNRITLTCQNDLRPRDRHVVVGKVDLTEWEQDQLWPDGMIDSSEQGFAITIAWRHCSTKQYEKAERILATIDGEPEDKSAAFDRERIRLRMLKGQGKTEEALALNERLMPLLEKKYTAWRGSAPDACIFSDSLLTLVYAGKLDEAKQTWRRLKSIQPELHPKLNKRARRHIQESIERSFESCMRIIVPDMSSKARLTVEQIGDILGVDVKTNELFKHYTFWDWNPEYEKPKYANWDRRLEELASHYKSHPPPEKVELVKRKKTEEYGVRYVEIPGIEGYSAYPLRGKLRDRARGYLYPESVGRVRVEDNVPDMELVDYDLVFKSDTPSDERERCIFKKFGLEVVEVNEPRKVWIARHDGRELKDYNKVLAPLPYNRDGKLKAGMMRSRSSSGLDLEYLFRDFVYSQNADGRADCIIIIDETGITDKVSREGPFWEGPEAPELARKWFKDEMGIDFTEETRMMKTYVIRKRTK